MEKPNLLDINFNNLPQNLPINIYALRIIDLDKNETYDIIVEHNGYCPEIYDDRDQSNFNDYLSNLEITVINEFFKSQKLKKPSQYTSLIELMSDENGRLYHCAKTLNNENICRT